eukprot:CAMPEP_0205882412 /NCGR_PEP_ID=MMETSP1083-20121108/16982_1 /ASSEMBLY_ACC=CAM_ASM_000430 /TAXON_ID=97485 /ORGANISM="Prymnesium parvum, Strain Texoma1" /LENGTH=295 /DNA_ID=CAMNT_0053245567 /DNA_START=666 /DNA_END=1553 /DNA_ORIENTATION=-
MADRPPKHMSSETPMAYPSVSSLNRPDCMYSGSMNPGVPMTLCVVKCVTPLCSSGASLASPTSASFALPYRFTRSARLSAQPQTTLQRRACASRRMLDGLMSRWSTALFAASGVCRYTRARVASRMARTRSFDATLQLWRLPCQPHVCQLRVAESVEKDVGRLDVAVEHSTPCRQRRVQVHEGARRVTNGAHSLLRRRGLCLALHNGGLKLHISSTFRCAALSSVVTKRLDEDARNHRPIAWRVVRLAPGECVGRGDIEVVVRLDAEKTLVVGCVALILVVVEVDGHRNRSVIER